MNQKLRLKVIPRIRASLVKVLSLKGGPILGLFALILLRATDVSAASSISEIQRRVEERARAIIQPLDPDAIIFAQIIEKAPEVELPGTAFLSKGQTVTSRSAILGISKIEIQVITRLDSLPPAVKALLDRVSREYDVTPNVKVEPMPKELRAAAEAGKKSEKPALSSDAADKSQAASLREKLEDSAGLIFVGMVFTLLFMANAFFGRRLIQTVSSRLEKNLSGLQSSLETIGEGAATSAPADSGGAELMPTRGLSSRSTDDFDGFSLRGLQAILTDCYWTESDRYAAFLWRSLSGARKSELLEKTPLLGDYSAVIAGLDPENLSCDQDMYYLRPLALDHLNTDALLRLVQQYPALYFRISRLRREALRFSAADQIRFAALPQDEHSSRMLPDFSAITPSPVRRIRAVVSIQLRSVEEEEQVLLTGNLTLDVKAGIPSLAWLAELPPQRVQEILRPYSARDLASAWLGPRRVLDRLASAVPERKLKLVLEYAERSPGSRESPVFRSIHAEAIRELRVASKVVTMGTAQSREGGSDGQSQAA